MNLYKLSQDVNNGWDMYDSAIVCAETEDEARNIKIGDHNSWCKPEEVKIEYIGKARERLKKGIILSSFNAG